MSNQGYSLDIHQITHFDEVHIKQRYGGNGEFQLRFKREDGSVIKNESDTYNGITAAGCRESGYGPEQFRRKFKFEEEARMMLGVSMTRVKKGESFSTEGVRCPLFDYTGKIIVGMGKWAKLLSQVIKEVKDKGNKTYWVSKINCPAGREIYELDNLLSVTRIGKKTASLLNSVGLFTVKDVNDLSDIDEALSALTISKNRQRQISDIIKHAASNANPGKSTTISTIY